MVNQKNKFVILKKGCSFRLVEKQEWMKDEKWFFCSDIVECKQSHLPDESSYRFLNGLTEKLIARFSLTAFCFCKSSSGEVLKMAFEDFLMSKNHSLLSIEFKNDQEEIKARINILEFKWGHRFPFFDSLVYSIFYNEFIGDRHFSSLIRCLIRHYSSEVTWSEIDYSERVDSLIHQPFSYLFRNIFSLVKELPVLFILNFFPEGWWPKWVRLSDEGGIFRLEPFYFPHKDRVKERRRDLHVDVFLLKKGIAHEAFPYPELLGNMKFDHSLDVVDFEVDDRNVPYDGGVLFSEIVKAVSSYTNLKPICLEWNASREFLPDDVMSQRDSLPLAVKFVDERSNVAFFICISEWVLGGPWPFADNRVYSLLFDDRFTKEEVICLIKDINYPRCQFNVSDLELSPDIFN